MASAIFHSRARHRNLSHTPTLTLNSNREPSRFAAVRLLSMHLSATNPPLTPPRSGTDQRAWLPSREGRRHSPASCPFPLLGGVRGGFMVPMPAEKRKEAFPELRSGTFRGPSGARLVPSRSGNTCESALESSVANCGSGRAAEWDTPRSLGARLVPSRSGDTCDSALDSSVANCGGGPAAEWDTPRSGLVAAQPSRAQRRAGVSPARRARPREPPRRSKKLTKGSPPPTFGWPVKCHRGCSSFPSFPSVFVTEGNEEKWN